jgi:hypothetical protein
MKRALILGLWLVLPSAAEAQQDRPPLRVVAEETRALWQRQDAAGLVAGTPQLVIQLPGADPSAPVQRQQATKLLQDFFDRSEEVETVLHDAQELDNGWGLVELRRRYRVRGTQEIRDQLLLLSYRQSATRWTLVELRVGR